MPSYAFSYQVAGQRYDVRIDADERLRVTQGTPRQLDVPLEAVQGFYVEACPPDTPFPGLLLLSHLQHGKLEKFDVPVSPAPELNAVLEHLSARRPEADLRRLSRDEACRELGLNPRAGLYIALALTAVALLPLLLYLYLRGP